MPRFKWNALVVEHVPHTTCRHCALGQNGDGNIVGDSGKHRCKDGLDRNGSFQCSNLDGRDRCDLNGFQGGCLDGINIGQSCRGSSCCDIDSGRRGAIGSVLAPRNPPERSPLTPSPGSQSS